MTTVTDTPDETAAAPSATNNALRPQSLDGYIGQDHMKKVLRRFIESTFITSKAMPHLLLAGPSGMGKTTLAICLSKELGVDVYATKAPVNIERLLSLQGEMKDGDILLVDEVHEQAKGRSKADTSPEILYTVMEDQKLLTAQGYMDFPDITIMGCTTNTGDLPEAFTSRFVLKPSFEDYSDEELATIACTTCERVDLAINDEAAMIFARASRGVPRIIANFVAQAQPMMTVLGRDEVDADVADLILDNERVERDGLGADHLKYLTVLADNLRYVNSRQEYVAKASLRELAHGLGRPTDSAYVEHVIEPILLKRGLVTVGHGRELTDDGFDRLGRKRVNMSANGGSVTKLT